MNGFEYIRRYYRVPAYRLGRVEVERRGTGTITGTSGPHLLIRLDGQKRARVYHPTDGITYLVEAEIRRQLRHQGAGS